MGTCSFPPGTKYDSYIKGRLVEGRKAVKAAEHLQEDWLDQLLMTIIALQVAMEDERYLLRSKIAQELRRIIDKVCLNSDREIRLLLKPSGGIEPRWIFGMIDSICFG
jgi:hypothetical protein